MKKIVFAGCSFTAGHGWDDIDPITSSQIEAKDYPGLWVNLCQKNIDRFQELELENLGVGGASNTEIFENVTRFMSKHSKDIDTIFCQWTAAPRYNFNVGFELWNTTEHFNLASMLSHDVNLNQGKSYSREYIKDLVNRLLVMHHIHWEILKIVDYTNIITRLANLLNIKNIFFINGLCPWDNNYFVELSNVDPESYTPFTKKEILNIETRDDKDIHTLYKLAHSQYNSAGGINSNLWINLYQSFHSLTIDKNFDLVHPGTQSNRTFFNIITNRLKELQFIK
jgi:hypothetical protein